MGDSSLDLAPKRKWLKPTMASAAVLLVVTCTVAYFGFALSDSEPADPENGKANIEAETADEVRGERAGTESQLNARTESSVAERAPSLAPSASSVPSQTKSEYAGTPTPPRSGASSPRLPRVPPAGNNAKKKGKLTKRIEAGF